MLLEKHESDQKVLEVLLDNLLAQSGEDEKGCDNMTAILIKFG